MDAVISIGGQSFVDGLVRILGPALQAVRSPMPMALPGLTNGVLNVRSIQQVFPSAQGGTIELDLEIDLTAEVLLVASVAGETVNLTFANGTVTLPAATGSVVEQARTGTFATTANPTAGSETGTIAGVNTTLNTALNSLAGTLSLPQPTNPAPMSLNQIVGSIQLPAGVGSLGLPLPAVVPVAVNFTPKTPLIARIFLQPLVNNGLAGVAVPINASSAFGLVFSFATPPGVQVDPLTVTSVTSLQTALTNAFNTIAGQLLQGLPALAQPATNLAAVVTSITNAIPGAATEILTDAFGGLRARTGRLIYPVAATGSSCGVRALPTVGMALITVATNGSIVLQVGLDRVAVSPFPPALTPTAAVDTGVTITNAFVRDLLACLIEKFPNLSLPLLPPTLVTTVPLNTATWGGVTLTVGPLAFTGTMTLSVAGTPAGPGMTPKPKTITLAFILATSVGAPLVIGPALTAGLTFTLPIAFDLNGLASITTLRLSGPATPPAGAFTFGMGTGLIALLVVAAAGILGPIVAGPLPIFWPGFAVLAFLIVAVPFIITGIVGGLLGNAINQVLGGLHRVLESPVALPPGIFEAFGKLVPTTMVVDDLMAGGVLQTPTSPWAVLPLVLKGDAPPPKGGGGPKPPDTPHPPDIPFTPAPGLGTIGGR